MHCVNVVHNSKQTQETFMHCVNVVHDNKQTLIF